LSRAGVARLSGRAVCCHRQPPLRFKSAPDRIPRPRQDLCCGPATLPLSPLTRQVAGSSPARSTRAPVAQLVEQFSAVTPRPQQSFGHGPERDGSRVERPTQAGRSQGSKPAPVSPRRE